MSDLVPFTLRPIESPLPNCKAYRLGQCAVFVGLEAGFWHLSISHKDRYPSWDEIREARYRLVPDAVTMAMLLPPRAEYVNLHDHCFHLHQIAAPEVRI